MYISRLGARRQIRFRLDTDAACAHLGGLAGQKLSEPPHGDTLQHFLTAVPPSALMDISPAMIRSLLEARRLEKFRLLDDYYLLAVDMTGHLFLGDHPSPFTESCLTQTAQDGRTLYYRPVCEAKLVTRNGLALSVGTEFLENLPRRGQSKRHYKQDCEQKAIRRLFPAVKARFPRFAFCVLLDALHCNETTFSLCEANDWRFIITLKDGALPSVMKEFNALKQLAPENRATVRTDPARLDYAWGNRIPYGNRGLHVLECKQTDSHGNQKTFVWVTDIEIDAKNCHALVHVFVITMTYNHCEFILFLVYWLPKGKEPICRERVRISSSLPQTKNMSSKPLPENIRHRIETSCVQEWSSSPPREWRTRRLPSACFSRDRLSPSGGNDSSTNAWPDSETDRGAGGLGLFPPEIVVEVKALACELPTQRGIPLSRFSHAEIAREAVRQGITASISGATVWRWLSADAIRPWAQRSWLWPRDPEFAQKAGRVLDLYHGIWEKNPLGPSDHVICADEKTSIQARKRIAPGTSPAPGRARRVEFEYERRGALAYLAAWDVRHAKLFGCCEPATGIAPYRRLVDLVMQREPYRSARRVFWITDNGSSHRGQASVQRLRQWYPNAIQVHTPVHASWLNQIEIYFSIVQRKLLTPNDFDDLQALEDQLLAFQARYQQTAQPFQWKFTKHDLKNVLQELSSPHPDQQRAVA